jgi:FixJ family two-component response regulator
MNEAPVVYAVDDDPAALSRMQSLLSIAGLEVAIFNSGRLFLEKFDPLRPGCVVLDLHLPEMTGLEVQRTLAADGVTLPIIFLTADGDVNACAKAFKGGAFDFLEKPADEPRLMRSIRHALDADVARKQHASGAKRKKGVKGSSRKNASRRSVSHGDAPGNAAGIIERGGLTLRESDVMTLIVAGRSLKQIAGELQITIQTAAKHRARVWQKCAVANDVELVRLVLEAHPQVPHDGPPF